MAPRPKHSLNCSHISKRSLGYYIVLAAVALERNHTRKRRKYTEKCVQQVSDFSRIASRSEIELGEEGFDPTLTTDGNFRIFIKLVGTIAVFISVANNRKNNISKYVQVTSKKIKVINLCYSQANVYWHTGILPKISR